MGGLQSDLLVDCTKWEKIILYGMKRPMQVLLWKSAVLMKLSEHWNYDCVGRVSMLSWIKSQLSRLKWKQSNI